jgi:putative DNA primase/helicase
MRGGILMTHLYDNIPVMLKKHPNWVAWGVRGASPKSPYNPASLLSGRASPAKAGVQETWGSYQSAGECVGRGLAQGIGYEFDGSDIYGIDLDHVIYQNGMLAPQAQEIVSKLNSYTELSPSGTGLHIFVMAPGAEIIRHRKKDYFLEIYGKSRYFTVTGNIFGTMRTIETRARELQAIHDKFLLPEPPQKNAQLSLPILVQSTGHEGFLSIGLKRDKVFQALWMGQRHHGNESSDDIALMNKLGYWCNADINAMIRAFLQSPYHSQKDIFHKKKCQRQDYLPNTAKNACATLRSTAVADYERWQQRQHEQNIAR